ncbi:MAG: protease complex subunit PrcB family protein [Lachnospiraceae bacterium]
MRKFVAGLAALFIVCSLAGCGFFSTSEEKVGEVEYTVVEDRDLPDELKRIIDTKKDKELRMTYATKEYTYIVAGYGEQPTSGYSICVDDLYASENAVVVKLSLLGPGKDENITQVKTTPYIVIKVERTQYPVIFYL